MRLLTITLFILVANTTTGLAQNQLATRADAIAAATSATATRTGLTNWVQSMDTTIDDLPAGQDKTTIQGAWAVFVAAWSLADTAAGSQIGNALDAIEDGDNEPNPMLKGLHYASAVSWSVSAENQLDVSGDWDQFLAAIAGTGWTPPSSPPN